jgi:hypothetical protein
MPEIFPDGFSGLQFLPLLFGLVLLVAGRRIFWLLVGVIGFYFGFDLASGVLGLESQGLGLLIGVFAGIVGIFLALFIQKLAIGLAGFLIGGYFALTVMGADAGGMSGTELAAFVIGGIVCALFAVWLFELALILLSAVAGAGLIVQSVSTEPATATLGFLVLVVIGIAIQAGIGPRSRSGRKRRRLRSQE